MRIIHASIGSYWATVVCMFNWHAALFLDCLNKLKLKLQLPTKIDKVV